MTVLPDFPVETYDDMLPVDFEVPPVNPTPNGLYAATFWTEVAADEPSRHLAGVQVRPAGNYGGSDAFGVWHADWCAVPPLNTTPRKEGDRPAGLDAFEPMTVWAYDECDLTAPSRAEVEQRAVQVMRLEEQVAVEREFAERLKFDANDLPGTVDTLADLVLAIGYLEAHLALTNTLGFIHLGAQWAAVADSSQILNRSGAGFVTPMGHRWIFGGGYVDGLENTIVATSQPFGWRDRVQLRTTIDERRNTFAAIAERTVLVGYEAVVAAVEITG